MFGFHVLGKNIQLKEVREHGTALNLGLEVGDFTDSLQLVGIIEQSVFDHQCSRNFVLFQELVAFSD